jgi:hypothetical protein
MQKQASVQTITYFVCDVFGLIYFLAAVISADTIYCRSSIHAYY